MDVLVYSGGFLVEAYDLVDVIHRKSAAGVNFRILLGDSRCEAVRQRGEEEGLPTLPDRCYSTLEYLREVHQAAFDASPTARIPRGAANPDARSEYYTSDDEVRQEFTVIYRAEYVAGNPQLSSESTEVRWVPQEDIDHLTMDDSQRKRLQWALAHTRPYIDDVGD